MRNGLEKDEIKSHMVVCWSSNDDKIGIFSKTEAKLPLWRWNLGAFSPKFKWNYKLNGQFMNENLLATFHFQKRW